MTTFLSYELKVALLLIAFQSAYSLLLRRDTWFRLRRLLMLSSVILAFVLPLCVIEVHQIEVVNLGMKTTSTMATDEAVTGESDIYDWLPYVGQGIMALMLVGMALTAAKMAAELFRLHRFIRHIEIHKQENGLKVGLTDELIQPFSYMKYVVMSKSDYQLRRHVIMAHEQAHISHRHTLDLFLVNLALVVQWFNPAIWAISKEIVRVHEYEADEDVVNSGVNTETYFKLLMDKATSKAGLTFTNSFGEKGMLRNRIEMLASRRSSGRSRLKALYIFPLVTISLAVSAKTVIDYKIVEPQHNKTKGVINTVTAKEDKKQDVSIANDDTILYYVNSNEVDIDDIETIDPSSIEEVNIVKAIDEKTGIKGDEHPVAVYVDLADTIIKKGDDDTYEMYSDDHYLDEDMEKSLKKEMTDVQNKRSEIEEQSRQAVEEAKKRREEALERAHRASAKAKELRKKALERAKEARAEAEELRKEALERAKLANKARVEAEKKREEAMKQAEKALKESEKALRESQKALKESERVLRRQNRSLERKKKEFAIIADTLNYVVENNYPDSSIIRLYVSPDGSISNINAYKIDTINGNNYVVIRMKNGDKQVVSLYGNLKGSKHRIS